MLRSGGMAGAATFCAAILLSRPAAADDRPLVCVSAKRLPPGVSLPDVLRHVGAGLKDTRVAACDDPSSARVVLDGDASRISVEIQDGPTGKSIGRSFEIGSLPPDSRAVAVGLYVEELVLASWAETLLRKRDAAPPAVRAVVAARADLSPRPGPSFLGLGARAALFTGGVMDVGPSAELGGRASLFEGSLGFSARFAPDRASVHGSIAERSFSVGASLGLAVPVGARVLLRPLAAAELHVVSFEGKPTPGERGAAATLAAGSVGGGLGLDVRLGAQASLTTHAKLLGVVYAAEARDDGVPVLAASGFCVDLGLGVRVSFGAR